ncbi:TonB C-terminal domain-containing protein [Undibacterium sp. Xuan67W]|uniref:TonB C-terminal domain-containing protein n=1 Tax=Undibacterium sp. Xuan67W TaxID=3413057 RepID=UPI003BF07C80
MSITLGGQAFGLPGLNFPWKERRLVANDLLVLLLPAQPTTSTSAPEPAELPKAKHSAVDTPTASGQLTSMTMSDPSVEHSEITPILIPPPTSATTPTVVPAPPAEPVMTSQKRFDPQPTVVAMTSVAQNAPAQVNKTSLPINADSSPPKPVKQDTQEQAPEQIALEREKQNTEQLKQAELIATAQRENKQQEQVKQDATRAEKIAKNEAAQLELERQRAERQELARQESFHQENLRQEILQKEQARQTEQIQQEAARQELARADASRVEANRKETARQEQIRQAQLDASRQEQLRQDAARAEQTAKNEAARKEAERLETQRQELAQQEKLRRDTAQKELARQTEQAEQETSRQELAKAEATRLEASRREAARQEQIRQTQLDTARQEQLQQDAARAEQAARSEAARKETERVAAERQELARQESLRQESLRQENLRKETLQKEQARQEQDKLAQVQRERTEYETTREERLRAIGRQLNEEAAQRDAALKNPSRTLLPSVSSLRRGWLLGRADANADLVLYAEAMSRKIERNMAFDMVREVVKQPHVQPLVTVAIRADGSVEKVTFVVSSGVASIDDAIRKVVASQAPYPAFTPALARQYDVIEIRRTWIFDVTIRLQ